MARWNAYTEHWLSEITRSLKRKRVERFVNTLQLGPHDRILDLGSEDGSYLAAFYPYPHNIVLADVNEEPMRRGVKRYGLKGYVVIPEEGQLPIATKEFDAVWCNSVIEHVTIKRRELANVTNSEFEQRADKHQRQFASEIARVAKKYFVQTPYLHFPVESHSWLPFVQYLPQKQRYRLSKLLKSVWVKQWTADFHLFNEERFRSHFPDATEIGYEMIPGMRKALIAIRNC